MSETCHNCGTGLSCGCERITASDGTPCCNHCIQAYEIRIAATKTNNL